MILRLLIHCLCIAAIVWMVWNTVDISPRRPIGKTLETVPIPLLARIKMLSPALLLIALIELPAVIFGLVHWVFAIVSVALIAVILTLPMSLVLTDVGIRPGWKGFHRWTQFAGVRRSRRGVMLQHVGGHRGITLWLIGARDEDELVHRIRTLIREAYTGRRSTPIT